MTTSESTRPRWLIPAIIGAVVVATGAGLLFFFFSDDDPEEVSLEAAVAAATSTTATTTPPTTAADATTTTAADATTTTAVDATTTTTAVPAPPDGIEGVWAIDTSIGTFDFESATGSFVGFRIAETLGQGIGETEAVGRTGAVSGTMEIVGSEVTAVAVDADLSALTTDISQRDSRARGALNTDEFPIASFVLSEPIVLADGAADGQPVAAEATGELTVNNVTQSVTFAIEAQLVEDIVVVVATTEVTFSDFGVEVPSAGIVLAVADFGTIEMQLLYTRG